MPLKRTPIKHQESTSSAGSNPPAATPITSNSPSTSVKKIKKAQRLIMEQVEAFVHQRGLAKGKLTRILNILHENDELPSSQLRVYAKKIDSAHKEYHDIQEKMLPLIPSSSREEHDAHFLIFDELHDQVLMALEDHMERLSVAPVGSNPNVAAPLRNPVMVQQPLKVPIPTFDGKYENWSKFKVVFRDLVDNTADPPAIKLYHLDKALVGSAAGIIDAKTINDGNYKHAWEILQERYENLRHMVGTHIHGLFSLRKMANENGKELRALVDECSRHVENLKFLNQEFTGISEQFVVHLLSEALDKETRRRWETTIKHGELPSYDATIKFLKEQCFILERCETSNSKENQPAKKSVKSTGQHSLVTTSASESKFKCEFCGDSQHKGFRCPQFLAMSVPQRLAKVRERNVCFNCLRKGHRGLDCPSNRTCVKCQRKHHSLLHADSQPFKAAEIPDETKSSRPAAQVQAPKADEQRPSTSTQVTTAACSTNKGLVVPSVLLLTAVVNVMDRNNHPHPCRVLLDSASQVNLISQGMADRLGLDGYHTNVRIAGVDGMLSRTDKGIEVQIRSRYLDYQLKLNCLITKRVTSNLPVSNIDIRSWEIPAGVQLSDPSFNSTGGIDMLIGNQWFLKLLLPGRIILSEELPIITETKFGWVVGGTHCSEAIQDNVVYSHSVTIEELCDSIQRFWEVESVPQQFQSSTEEDECERHFIATHRRDETGRYVVQLPLRDSLEQLGESSSLALRRFFGLEKRFAQQPELKRQYVDFMQEYESLGHCKEVYEKNDAPGMRKWYLPHHAVLRPSNTTTKCRVVFDASAKMSGLSLNEMMKIGPISQSDLLAIVLRFREHRFVLTADIAKMYRQIVVADCHTPLQRIFWRKNPSDPLRVLELTTVTYGTASAPFLATRALLQLAIDEKHKYPLAASIVENSCYVDNALFGYDSLPQAFEAQRQLISMMEAGGFHLHKWSSNIPELLESLPREDREELVSLSEYGANEVIKTLGIMWNPDSDELMFVSMPTTNVKQPTKRQILSLVSQMFDPLGLVAPVVVIGKMLMQLVWKEKLDWDEPIVGDLVKGWTGFLHALEGVNQLRIPRRVVSSSAVAFEMHGFADASDVAYGACVYIRSICEDGSTSMKIISGKSKVAPIAPLSIPRKELLAALLLHRLVVKILSALKMSFNEVILWSDSQVILAWLTKQPEQLDLYVRNRVREITATGTKFEWKYIPTKDNPADIVSRGLSASKVANSDLWWNGPAVLRDAIYRMEIPPPLPIEEIPELRPIVSVNIVARYDELPVFTKFESFRKLQRVLAYVLRFRNNVKKRKENRTLGKLPTVIELREAMKTTIRVVQNLEYNSEIQRVLTGEPCKYMQNLCPLLDHEGLLRVGDRLRHSKLPFDVKHQWILPANNPVVRSLIKALHQENLHVGPSELMAILRQQFWIPKCRNTIRLITRICVRCFKVNPKTLNQFMGDLPGCRLEKAPAFLKVGVDFAGPIMIRQGVRKAIPVKGYICVFICMVTKGIHLEATWSP
ncbi:uncharacterized protein LOC131679895 [Topomyia yanbarensis]|uniref:uncharacterized protein LOC131679895 n=1 Tax=Topomyia yanbarensis TaxID=2498891 RepID=UPI00273B4449|nr:uncharacterized protein LOC131679895 [Topomyia yanbarensis]